MKRLPIVASIATYNGREDSLLTTLRSIRNQVDYIFVHTNGNCNLTDEHLKLIDYRTEWNADLADNGKFFALKHELKEVYFLTMDDDLWYNPNYVKNMISKINEHECIVTHHGRKLIGLGLDYYSGHRSFRCLASNLFEFEIDVAGTGVTGFKTSYFNPKIWNAKDLRMSDIVFSLEAAAFKKKIMLIPHEYGDIKQVGKDTGICGFFSCRPKSRQNELADEIYRIKYLK